MSIVVQQLTKIYGKQKAIDNLSFEIKTGEIVGFLGPNGAGKTTTMKILTGYIPPTQGSAFVNNLNVEEQAMEVRKQIGYLPEHNPLYTDMYVKEYLHFTASAYHLKNASNRVKEMIEITGLQVEQHKKIGQLSKGYRQRVGLAQAMIHQPKVLILDEPTSGLDPNQIVEIRNLISTIGKDKTVILSTHIMQEVEAMCNRVMIINKGKIVANGKPEELKKNHNQSIQVLVTFNKTLTQNQIETLNKIGEITALPNGTTFNIQGQDEENIKTQIFNFAVANQLILNEVTVNQNSLEDIFKQVTQKK